ncbi:hypothetical protein HJG60_009712 [Phyllostomus discolor]|uniref:Uncharacterized protein n=1 Tax=Phyllostomus discolor TaxID=89673 RepID=A0A834B2E7_9CHIR|nr:hypothetical protein HJG60_009712 [Phyllostomus discolor]
MRAWTGWSLKSRPGSMLRDSVTRVDEDCEHQQEEAALTTAGVRGVVCLQLGRRVRGRISVNLLLESSEARLVDQGQKTSGCHSSATLASEILQLIFFQAPPFLLANYYSPLGFNLQVTSLEKASSVFSRHYVFLLHGVCHSCHLLLLPSPLDWKLHEGRSPVSLFPTASHQLAHRGTQ